MTTEFFMPMIPPTITHQQHRIKTVNGKPVIYDGPELQDARKKLVAHLAGHKPEQQYDCGVRLIVKWLFPITGKHMDGEYRITRPDTDNLNKLLKDCMTDCHYWKDDAVVASEIIEKFWAWHPGIYVRIEEL